jgi:hypothetical protein
MTVDLLNDLRYDRQNKRRLKKKLVFKRRIYYFKEYCRINRQLQSAVGIFSKPTMPKGLPLYTVDYLKKHK